MGDRHKQSFFGQQSAMFLDSGPATDPVIYLRFIKKKGADLWEKPSVGEGTAVKINLLELIAITDVLTGAVPKWSTVHKSAQGTKPITVSTSGDTLWFNVGTYSKSFKYPETVLVTRLFQHILHEKIAWATCEPPRTTPTEPQTGVTASNQPPPGARPVAVAAGDSSDEFLFEF
jgi:hypothetical protein